MLKFTRKKIIDSPSGMHVPVIMPDEFFLGYGGRIGNLNCHPDLSDTNRILKSWVRKKEPSLGKTIPVVYCLSKLLNMHLETFIKQHTLAPITRAIQAKEAHNERLLTKSGKINLTSLQTQTSRKIKTEACFCASCVKEDLHYHGFSYWRRSHQLSGVDWCSKHDELLFEVDQKDVYKHQPATYYQNKKCNQANIENYSTHPVISRYVQMISDAIEHRDSLHFKAISQVLLTKVNELGIRTKHDDKKSLFSDVLNEQVPYDWLKKHFPSLVKENSGQYIYRFDDLPKPRGTCKSFTNTMLAAAILFKSSDEALYHLTHHQYTPRPLYKHTIPDASSLKDAYIKHKGNVRNICEELSLNYDTALRLIKKEGLLPLSNIDKATLTAMIDFLNGESLLNMMQSPGVNLKLFEKMIRIAGNNFSSTMKRINTN